MSDRTFDALPDPADFRDRLFEPTLIEVPTRIELAVYQEHQVPILDQGREGACTGFGLATIANYLLRRRRVVPDQDEVSARMFYEMARRYDEWEGEDYSGSSCRGAMKGWHKHGVCSGALAPYDPGETGWKLSAEQAEDALRRPLGAYYRVNHKDIVSMHTALAEVGALYASAQVHTGWQQVGRQGHIVPGGAALGGHAFAIVAYDADGFWVQNSWGPGWGKDGFALLTYDDWLEHAMDVWVARLGAPIRLRTATGAAIAVSAVARKSQAYAACDVRPHVVSIGNEGELRARGAYGTSAEDVERLFRDDFPRLTATWSKPRLLLYAHGGLTSEESAIGRLMEYRATLLANQVYPVAFVWRTDYWTTLTNILQDASRRRRPEGMIGSAKDFLLDRLDDALEPLARALTGKLQWDEMKENAARASSSSAGAMRVVAAELRRLLAAQPGLELHVVGHSAGSILLGPLVELITAQGRITKGALRGATGLGSLIATCTMWAPACTVAFFASHYAPAVASGAVRSFALYTLTDKAERDDHCANLYHKSLLYLVSNAFERRLRIPLLRDGEPLLGMARFLEGEGDADLRQLRKLVQQKKVDWVSSPNGEPDGSPRASRSTSHGGFDDDQATVRSTLARVLGRQKAVATNLEFAAGAGSRRDTRQVLSQSLVS